MHVTRNQYATVLIQNNLPDIQVSCKNLSFLSQISGISLGPRLYFLEKVQGRDMQIASAPEA